MSIRTTISTCHRGVVDDLSEGDEIDARDPDGVTETVGVRELHADACGERAHEDVVVLRTVVASTDDGRWLLFQYLESEGVTHRVFNSLAELARELWDERFTDDTALCILDQPGMLQFEPSSADHPRMA